VAEDEAKHFSLLSARLVQLNTYFGSQAVHAGLWESATRTAHSLTARLCIIHLVHEARGLDVNPTTIEKFRAVGDTESVKVLEVIHWDEVTGPFNTEDRARAGMGPEFYENLRGEATDWDNPQVIEKGKELSTLPPIDVATVKPGENVGADGSVVVGY
ncbi:hypothetical protein FRC09_010481, partial [Ceratobasidium sp. 395]